MDQAIEAKRGLNLIHFDGRIVESHFWEENKFKKDDFKMPTIKETQERDTAYIGIENLAIDFA